MSCQCQGIEQLFDEPLVTREMADYRKKGPSGTTRLLINALKQEGVQDLTVLDIGGGVGALQHALLAAGARHATDVDASPAYIQAARQEACRRGLEEQISFVEGNFVDLAARIPPAGVVTLDRVICCYDDMENLVGLSAARAERLYGVVYPRDEWWVQLAVKVMNFYFRLRGQHYRSFAHPTRAVEEIVRRHGLKRRYYRRTLGWQVAVFGR